ncbi:hypothetical protein NGA_0609200 [Nannochloropsis gaditana CCMP526]|uniref:uncharacterized protein n=1 Tax=Nannochloropsis gaditana (strain CCMP526) TaxID=1093141 RepID=UPI00029F7BAF|nr:hypothetical protein NGA_0609200 [Nannochloropsis gaditana CCMP526]EKU20837.1 hypothetical protein NGA_0609200 [Nannochloropsis gaditana CCMP526]|eukprot:XP_005855525.1 hypothetical protein NGA_0609200 [Nannochloropsis gaditana CCMP526]
MPAQAVLKQGAAEEEKELKQEMTAMDGDEWEDEGEEEGEGHARSQARAGGDGVCLLGQYLLGSLFGALAGFVMKRLLFRGLGTGSGRYSRGLMGMDVVVRLAGGEGARR